MKKTLIFGGTVEGRELAWKLCDLGIDCTVSVATDYGEMLLKDRKEGEAIPAVIKGRLTKEEMTAFFEKEGWDIVVDATHPHATLVTANIREACHENNIRYIRLKRRIVSGPESAKGVFATAEEAAEAIKDDDGVVMLTTGVKELGCFTEVITADRLYARILPGSESLESALSSGMAPNHIIAMQGPFSYELNLAMFKSVGAKIMVTKDGGEGSGFEEKIRAAQKLGMDIYVISVPEESGGLSFNDCLDELCRENSVMPWDSSISVTMIGMGPGGTSYLLDNTKDILREQDVVFGAKRLIETLKDEDFPIKQSYSMYDPDEILEKLRVITGERPFEEIKVALLYSGDTGFFSGAGKMRASLKAFTDNSGIPVKLKIIPGLSSMSYLSAATGISYDNTKIISHHGKTPNMLNDIKRNSKTFILFSDSEELKLFAYALYLAGLHDVTVYAGYDLGSEKEKIAICKVEKYEQLPVGGLCCAFLINDGDLCALTPGLKDTEFDRDSTPMTKEEIRILSVCKLGLKKDSVVYDVGCGTGSITAECARVSDSIRVYAIDANENAAKITSHNVKKLGLENVTVINELAPDAFEGLEPPTHVFIGGSHGNLEEIVRSVMLKKRGRVRFVMNVVTFETIGAIYNMFSRMVHDNEEVVCVQISRTREMGRYHLFNSENLVYIVSFEIP
ncbi:MAG: precorrin-6A reductase [Lachnospiraceae bacterium]|nr:precorrin-6A reductase [Lachnospiraceae bacterium]